MKITDHLKYPLSPARLVLIAVAVRKLKPLAKKAVIHSTGMVCVYDRKGGVQLFHKDDVLEGGR